MSNLYVTEPATNGKVIIDTTAGEIEIELWGKETPLAVRNFLALSMEGYYDGVIFHRVVPGFIVQTGDPSGTGTGGESFYGETFKDEIHGRLKFNRRGLVGMANPSKRNSNGSQFFITLDRADELTNKHTLFGKITGTTIFNVLNIGNLDLDEEERPKNPPKIKGIRIIENPFDDIVPRITVAEKRAQAQARLEAKKDQEQRERRSKAKKNTGLLSFGDSEEVPEAPIKKKGMGRQDLAEEAEPLPEKAVPKYVDLPPSLAGIGEGSKAKKAVDLKDIRAQHERDKLGSAAARQAEIKKMQDDLRKLKKRTGEASDSEDSEDESKRKKRRAGPSFLEEELSKYKKGRGRAVKSGSKRSRRDEEDDILAEMGAFSRKVADLDEEEEEERGIEEGAPGGLVEEGLEVDDDVGWMKHKLKFMVDEKELTRRAEDEYAVIDPRAKARQLEDAEKRDLERRKRGARTAADVGRR